MSQLLLPDCKIKIEDLVNRYLHYFNEAVAANQTLTNYLQNLELDDIKNLLHNIEEYLNTAPLAEPPPYLTMPPPEPVGNYIPRDEDTEAVFTKLKNNRLAVVVNGIGGVGKTQLALQFCKRYQDDYSHLGWINYKTDVREDCLNQMTFISEKIKDIAEIDIKWNMLINELNRLPRILLIFDNANDLKGKEQQYLKGMPGAILLTAWQSYHGFQPHQLGFFNMEKCKELFRTFYSDTITDLEEQALEQIITLADHHTLTVELMAKTAKHARLSLTEFKTKLKAEGFNLQGLREKVETEWDQGEKRRLFDHLQKLFAMTGKLETKEEYILKNLCLLPSQMYLFADLKAWLELESYDDLHNLIEKGWLIEKENTVQMIQVIKEVAKDQLKPQIGDIASLINNLQHDFEQLQQANKYADLSEKISLVNEIVPHWIENYVEPSADHPDTLGAMNNLALTYWRLGRHKEALELQEQVLPKRQAILGADHPFTLTAMHNLALTYGELDRHREALELLEQVSARQSSSS